MPKKDGVIEIEGTDFAQTRAACDDARPAGSGDVPPVILARTIKGQGFSFTAGVSEWHSRVATAADVAAAHAELGEDQG